MTRKEYNLSRRKYNRENSRRYRKEHPEYIRDYVQKLKTEVFSRYCKGKIRCQCKWCPIRHISLLSLDHIKPVRSRRKYIGWNLWLWLRRQGYPKGFQILCMSCNYAKRVSKRCPRYGKKH